MTLTELTIEEIKDYLSEQAGVYINEGIANFLIQTLELKQRIEEYSKRLDIELLRTIHLWHPSLNDKQMHDVLIGVRFLIQNLLDPQEKPNATI